MVVNPATTSTTNIRPTSDAGPDQTITLPTSSVTVNGTAADSDGTVVSNTWRRISGPKQPSITSFTSRNTTITNMTVAGTYVFWFNATDDKGAGASDEILITVKAADAGTSTCILSANAGPDKTITLPTNTVTLV